MSVTETDSPTDTSDENQGASDEAASGSGNSGDSGGTTSAADSFAEERERLTAQARSFQARADKAEQDRKDLEAQLKAKDNDDSGSQPATLSPEQIRQEVFTANQLLRAEAPLREEFPLADSGIFDRIDSFDSVEALRAAAEASHLKTKKVEDEMREKVTQEVMTDVQTRFGIELTPAEPATPVTQGDPTLEELNAMSQVQLDALEAKSPGLIARVAGLENPVDKAWGT